MSARAKLGFVLGVLVAIACGDDESPSDAGTDASESAGGRSGMGGRGGRGGASGEGGESGEGGTGGRAGAGGRRSGLSCAPRSGEPVQCGGRTCPTEAEHETDPCFVPCCVVHDGAEVCGFRGTSSAFTTQCVLPAVADPACDEVPQFQGCCEQTQGVCGIIGGFQPGCQTESRFATLPANPKSCGDRDDGGAADDAGR